MKITTKTVDRLGEKLHLEYGHMNNLDGVLVKTTHISLFDDQGWGYTKIMTVCSAEDFLEDEVELNAFIQKARFALGLPATCVNTLTRREIHVLNALRARASNSEIADVLCVCEYTVKAHLYKIYKKLNVKNRAQAIEWAELNLQAA
ncbi:helix-turn-helix transcriptional regulator [Vibrio sp. JC009]|uniref:helix-turn-helix domain-containing protein n=1 Tax=Vibrio sp. JC009 TaxID=2912314 RepID=UPI0023B08401|nr:helix-turn-helix transcriptional regulator [Vibrio sp. JC009]WED23492.1 helix-turn-helix transcriptional regulator [Vibrio sp. JC009]